MEDDYDEQMQDQLDMQSDQEKENQLVSNSMVESNLELINNSMQPKLQNIKRSQLEEDANDSIKEFLDITQDLALGVTDKVDRMIIEKYNYLIGVELQRGLKNMAIIDMRRVAQKLLLSRSDKGKNLELLFTRLLKIEKLLKKEKAER